MAGSIDEFRKAYPYPNLRFVAFVQYREPEHKGQGTELPASDLTDLAHRFEREHAFHVLAVAHRIDPFMEVETVERWIEAAPTACLGVMMHENAHLVDLQSRHDLKIQGQIDDFIDHFMLPVMDVCLKHHKHFYLMEKQLWWVAVPAVPSYAKRIFAAKYRPIIVPMVEESNSRCPELNFVARVGLWRSDVVPSWGLNLIDDELRTCKFYEYNFQDREVDVQDLSI